ncbi:MAG: Mrp/NBP35 family ATP-binding protein [Candidatus Hodarchaeota archaeon]
MTQETLETEKSQLTRSRKIAYPRETVLEQKSKLEMRMKQIKHKIAIMSGKGGVGKSMITANLAAELASKDSDVGILDADIHGPCIPKMLGIQGQRPVAGLPGIFPVIGPLNIKVVSMDFFLPDSGSPVIWRGPMKMTAIRQFLSDVEWGRLDFLFVDLPPGTGDESLSIMQLIPNLDGVIMVTAPSEVSQLVVKKAINMAKMMKVSILGIIENMSGFICPNCGSRFELFGSGGGENLAQEMGVPLLVKVPIDPAISNDSDRGKIFVIEHKDSPSRKIFDMLSKEILEWKSKNE